MKADTKKAPTVPAPRYSALDGWRGVAACMVALFHWRGQLGYLVNSHVGQWPIVRNAYLFVDFFFVLSGFVIAARYQEALADRVVRFSDFVALRVGRLLPLQLFTLAFTFAFYHLFITASHDWIDFATPLEDVSLRSLALNALLLHGMHTTGMLTWNHPSWSISAEFWTYLVFAGAWLSLRKRAWVFAVLAAVAMPVLLFKLKGHMNATYDWGFLRSVLGFALGVLVFNAMARAGPLSTFSGGRATLIEGVIVVAIGLFVSVAGETPVSIAAPFVFAGAVAVFSLQRGEVSQLFASPVGEALGRWSYSIYLLQFPLQQLMMFFALYFGATGWVQANHIFLLRIGARPQLGPTQFYGDLTNVVMLIVVIGASALTYRIIEAPARQRVRHWVSARSDARV